jgi:hypothetical protein
MSIKDIFGGSLDESRQFADGHHWVGLDTTQEHCMSCRRGIEWRGKPCEGPPYCVVCGGHLDEHQGVRHADHEFKKKVNPALRLSKRATD